MKHLLVEKSIKKIECNKTIKKKSSERTNKSSCLVICLIFAVIKAKRYKLSAVKNHSSENSNSDSSSWTELQEPASSI